MFQGAKSSKFQPKKAYKIQKSASNITIFYQKLCFGLSLLELYFKFPCILLSLIFYSFRVKKLAFFGFLPKSCLFSLRGGVQKFFWSKNYLKHILITFLITKNNILDIKNNFQTFYGQFQHIRGNRFISISLCFSKKCEICSLLFWGENIPCPLRYQNPFVS